MVLSFLRVLRSSICRSNTIVDQNGRNKMENVENNYALPPSPPSPSSPFISLGANVSV